jgi:hypothetical protein
MAAQLQEHTAAKLHVHPFANMWAVHALWDPTPAGEQCKGFICDCDLYVTGLSLT